MTTLEAVQQATAIVQMAEGRPINPASLAANVARINPQVGAAITSVCALRGVALVDKPGFVVVPE